MRKRPIESAASPIAESPEFRRPESVLVVVYTGAGEFLLLERLRPPGFWQSVTGSLHWGETATAAARRELHEETGIASGVLTNLHWTQTFEILPRFGHLYAPGTHRNLEHAFALRLPRRCAVRLSDGEHVAFRWLDVAAALELASSYTNRAVIEKLRR
jgi:dihydroneopterin triphosphate diphosphatase